jgi:uncharacterized Zn finger protein
MVQLLQLSESEPMRYLVCFRCGSGEEDIEFLKENAKFLVYRCKNCQKTILKMKKGEEQWNDYTVKR